MFVLGVTGPSGAGKGTACGFLKELGFYHIDTDRLVPLVYPKALPALCDAFGTQIAPDGVINKAELAKAAFSSPEKTALLNSIMHPLIMDEVQNRIRLAENEGYSRVTVDGAALHEAHAEEICDKLICILAPKEQRMDRIILRDSISKQAAGLRIEAQKEDSYYAKNTDAVLVNHSVEQLKTELFSLIKEWQL